MAELDQIIFSTARNEGMPRTLSALIVAQAKHETNNYASNVFAADKNLFGYGWVSGSTYQIGRGTPKPEGGFYAKYNDAANSVREVTAWIKRRQEEGKFPVDLNEIKSPGDYAALLRKSGYYKDTVTNYTSGLERYFKMPGQLTWLWALMLSGISFLGYRYFLTKSKKFL